MIVVTSQAVAACLLGVVALLAGVNGHWLEVRAKCTWVIILETLGKLGRVCQLMARQTAILIPQTEMSLV